MSKKIVQILIILSTIIGFNEGFAQKSSSFELIEVRSDRTYFNPIQYNNKLYIGTSTGSLIIDDKSNNEKIDPSLKGYLSIEDEKLIGNSVNFGHIIKEEENAYNYLLPESYKNLISRQTKYNGRLYIINSGKLFLFKENNFTISHDSLSVRSITPNYIGSYKGVFKNGSKLKFPEYTDGYIREFGNETIICYEGLFRDSAGKISVYANSKKEIEFAGKNLGNARDILKLDNGEYALVTTKGIYQINFTTNNIITIYEDANSFDHYSIFKIDHIDKNALRIFFTAQNKIFYYVVDKKERTLLLDSKHSQVIKQAFFPNTIDKIYVLFEDKLSVFNLNNQSNTYSEDVLMNGLLFCHNFILHKERVFVSTNVGLHMFDLKKNKSYLNIVPIEINNRSLTVINDTIKFGTINGIINLSNENVDNIAKEIDNYNLNNIKETNSSPTTNTIILLAIITLLASTIIILIVRLINTKKKILDAKTIESENYGEANKENIIYYIKEHITTVTINSIREQFKLTPIMLYDILGNDKPGEIIRNYRMDLVRKYRRLKMTEEEISQKTGFSVSYLKKIY